MIANVAAYVSTQLVSEFRYARRLISPSIPSCISCGEYAAKALLLVSCYQQGSPPRPLYAKRLLPSTSYAPFRFSVFSLRSVILDESKRCGV
jgi:hypothetical protein